MPIPLFADATECRTKYVALNCPARAHQNLAAAHTDLPTTLICYHQAMVDEEDTATEVAVLEKYKAHSTIQSGSLDGLLQFLHEKIAEFRKIRDQEREAAAKKLTPLLEAMVVWIEFDPMDEEGLLAKAQETLRTQMPEVECKPADRPAAESEGAEQTV